MEIKDLYRDIIRDHNLYPDHKKVIAEPDLILNPEMSAEEIIAAVDRLF